MSKIDYVLEKRDPENGLRNIVVIGLSNGREVITDKETLKAFCMELPEFKHLYEDNSKYQDAPLGELLVKEKEGPMELAPGALPIDPTILSERELSGEI